MTNDQAKELKDTLESLMSAISKKESIANLLVEISRLQTDIAPSYSPQLNHFLQNRSYAKALEYLSNGIVIDDPDRPDCDEDHP